MERRKRAMVSDQLEQEDKKLMRKGLWSPDEDERLYSHITHYGVGTWSSVAELAGNASTYMYILMYLLYMYMLVLVAGWFRVIHGKH